MLKGSVTENVEHNKKSYERAGRMAQEVRCLLCELEDLSHLKPHGGQRREPDPQTCVLVTWDSLHIMHTPFFFFLLKHFLKKSWQRGKKDKPYPCLVKP